MKALDPNRPLNPFEQWMVKSNLQTIASGEPAATIVAALKANGYHRIAAGVEHQLQNKPTQP